MDFLISFSKEYIYVVCLFIFSCVCCSYAVDRFQSMISWGEKRIGIKRSWCLLSSENIHTKAPSRIETASKAITYATVDEKAAAPTSFSSPTHICWHLVQLSRMGVVWYQYPLPWSSDQSVSLAEKDDC